MIKNLSQLKKKLITGVQFCITEHRRAEVIGERRVVNCADTTAIYSLKLNESDLPIQQPNGGRGFYLPWGKASSWELREDGICAQYSSPTNKTAETLIIAIRVFD